MGSKHTSQILVLKTVLGAGNHPACRFDIAGSNQVSTHVRAPSADVYVVLRWCCRNSQDGSPVELRHVQAHLRDTRGMSDDMKTVVDLLRDRMFL